MFTIFDVSNFKRYRLEFDRKFPNTCNLTPIEVASLLNIEQNSFTILHLYRKLSGIPIFFTEKKAKKEIIVEKDDELYTGVNSQQLKNAWENVIRDMYESVSTSGLNCDFPLVNDGCKNIVVRIKGDDSNNLYVRNYSNFITKEYSYRVESVFKEQFNLYKLILPDFE